MTPASVEGLDRAAGDALPEARGHGLEDQTKIDVTVARLCAAEVFTPDECRRHTTASATRRAELAAELDGGAAGV